MKRLFIPFIPIAVLTLFSIKGFSQAERYFDERYIYTHSFINPVLINPGAAAFHEGHQLLVNYRNKWASFDGAPKTITMGYDGILADRLGIGAMFMQDNFGSLRMTKGQLSLSYGIESEINKVRFGISTEFIQHGLNSVGSTSEVFDFNDPLYNLKREGASFLDVSFGIFGKYLDQFTYGIALPSLISSRIDSDQDNERDLGFLVNLGYHIKSESGISIEPSILVKKLNRVPTHVDLNARLGFLEDKFTSGITYGIGADKRLGFLLGFAIDKLDIFYSYNTSMQEFQDYNNGSHEITVRLSLKGGQKDAMGEAAPPQQ